MKCIKQLYLFIGVLTMLAIKPTIEIKYLKDCPEYVVACAQWSFNTWGKYTPHRTLEDYIESRKTHLNDTTLPLTLIAFEGEIPVGMCSLTADQRILPELTPWQSTLYVEPEYRNKGIGTLLEKAICKKARQMSYTKLYNFTVDKTKVPWYEKIGWLQRSIDQIYGYEVTVMEKTLHPQLTEQEKQTINCYDQLAATWTEKYDPNTKVSFWAPELALFQKYLPIGTILDIGIGGGVEAAEFIKNKYSYIGIDAAQGLVDIAKKRFPDGTFFKQNVYELNLPIIDFDGFWCSAVLLHIPPQSINHALQNIKRHLKPGALGFISIAQGAGERFDSESNRYFYLYEEDEFTQLLRDNGFSVEQIGHREREAHLPWLASWLTFFVRVAP